MKAKNNLNNIQRKMLDVVYCKKVDEKIKQHQALRTAKRDELTKSIKEDAEKSSDLKEYKVHVARVRELEEKFKSQGFSLSHYGKEVNFSVNYGHKKVDDFDAETKKSLSKLSNAKDEIRLKIYGLETTYEEAEKEVVSVISALGI